ncbi:putative Quinol--cytochrome-c reductase [Candidatus Propionivibrio aalborgensis]|uniref:Putative Quinol--cytochrome-c reductase n=1 Tax=Candidatus Propionivibrio aalborgensis TaxID=1860101 RepID=A0A1A8Y1K9_9RHOO|nr:putative Quinol--cytochrome-c reductase [Candidatus Propionivibrio aalborgensis]
MSTDSKIDGDRRRLIVATAAVGGIGAITAMVPFLSSMLPSERAKAAGAPVEVDIGSIGPGQMITVEWRGKPVWVLNRTEEMLSTLPKLDSAVADPKSEVDLQPESCKNETRSIKPNMWVAVGICTHLGCSPSSKFQKGPAPVMVRPSILQAVFSRKCRLLPTLKCRRTPISPIRAF